jgi:PhoPQ-activated pathogenicity-related protein
MKLACFIISLLLVHLVFSESILEEYVNRPDSSTSYKLHNTFSYIGGTAYVLNVTSHTYLTKQEVSDPVCRHWVLIMKPNNLKHLKPLLIIVNGQSKEQQAPTSAPLEFAAIPALTNSIVVLVFQVPYQKVSFFAEPKYRQEDGEKKKKKFSNLFFRFNCLYLESFFKYWKK